MTKYEMTKVVENHTYTPEDVSAILTAVDAYSEALLQQTPCTTLLPDVEQVIKSRIEYFNNHYHKYEGNELSDALSTIKRLVPPSMFEDFVRQ